MITPEQLQAIAVAYNPDLDWQTRVAGEGEYLRQLFWTEATCRGLRVMFSRKPDYEWCEINFSIRQATDDPLYRDRGGYPLCEFRFPADKLLGLHAVLGLRAVLPKFGYFVDNFGD